MNMKAYSFSNTEPSGTNLDDGSYFNFGQKPNDIQSGWSFRWSVQPQGIDSEPTYFGEVDVLPLLRRLAVLEKLERLHRERLAAVMFDTVAQTLFNFLDRETSIRWEDLPNKADAKWSETCKSVALLAGANLCEVGPTRFRLTEYGDKLLSESPLSGRTHPAIES